MAESKKSIATKVVEELSKSETIASATDEYIGKVVKIINEYRLIINVGTGKLNVGDVVAVCDNSTEIVDPETGEKLGYFSFIKGRLEVVEVQEKFSVCFSDETELLSSPLTTAFSRMYYENEQIRPLKVNEEQNENLQIGDIVISIGDPIKIIESAES